MFGVPHHKMAFKAPVMHLCNLDERGGLCNGSRLHVLRINIDNIKVKIILGGKVGTVFVIPTW